MADNHLNNIKVYHKKRNINIGVIIFGIVFIYLAAAILMYLTENHVTPYEVREGSILKDNAYTGFIIRDEMIVSAQADGYVNYFALEGSKVGAKTRVYTLSDRKLVFSGASQEESQELTSEEQASILLKTQSFTEGFQESQFRDVYSLKADISTILESKSNQSRQAQLDAMSAANDGTLQIHYAESDGIIYYTTDGFEKITVNDLTEDILAKKDYTKNILKDEDKIQAGDPVYKLIRSNGWYVAILLEDDMAEELRDTSYIKVRFAKDNETTTARFSIQEIHGNSYGILSFDSGMIRYADDRYLDLELILEDETGLKIPKSSVTEREFYLVPEDYLTQGGNSNATGVLVETGKDNPVFREVSIYDQDEETGKVYLDTTIFEQGTVLRKPDSTDTCKLEETQSVQGVYNINKGYAVFKEVDILCESDDYYIVASGSDYGLANYDHIALDGEGVRENDVVF